MPTYLAALCVLIGALIFWRTLVNANRMDRHTRHGIRVLNLSLLCASALVVLSPFLTMEIAVLALLAALSAFLVCMFIGRRPTDKVLG